MLIRIRHDLLLSRTALSNNKEDWYVYHSGDFFKHLFLKVPNIVFAYELRRIYVSQDDVAESSLGRSLGPNPDFPTSAREKFPEDRLEH